MLNPTKAISSMLKLQWLKTSVSVCALFLLCLTASAQNKSTLSGTISDSKTGETLIGATVTVKSTGRGVSTNAYGYYSLSVPKGEYEVLFSFIGYKTETKTIDLNEDVKLDLELSPSSVELEEAVVEGTSEARKNVESVEMSTVNMSMEAIKKIPAFMGEVDVIKAIQLLPGVQTVGEGGSGFYVRGGAVDQNLILLDEATVYNASHLLGFFSVFNSDAIKDVQLYKGGIPARYGGRLSSVLDIRMKEGNAKEFTGSGGIGTVASRLTLQGPIKKDKGAFLISGRRTYVDLFLKLSPEQALQDSRLYFYDFNAKANYKLSENDRLFASGYFGRDVFGFSDLFSFAWGNTTGTLRWNHIYNSKLFSNITFVYSDYDYRLAQEDDQLGFEWRSNIEDISLKADYNYYANSRNNLRFGASLIKHKLNPGETRSTGSESILNDINISLDNALEGGIYVSNEHEITEKFTAIYGLRYSVFLNMGEGTQWDYNDVYEPVDSTYYGKWDVYNAFGGFEPRLGLNYQLNESSSVKASYNRMYQYMHLASNSTSASPLDVWFVSSPTVKPQIADQVAVGYFRNFLDDQLQGSVEVYYKGMQNSIDFKNHAQLLLNKHLEGELRFGEARAYGLELMVRKEVGDLTGTIGYTLSRTERKIPEIQEDWFPAQYDKTHDLSIMAAYTLNKRWSFGANFVYSTGAAVTFPTGRFEYMGEVVPVYSDRNGERMPAYHRLDLSATLQSKKNETRKWDGEWVFSVYNAYYRKNPYLINFRQDANMPNETYAELVYLLPIVPAITYNFSF
ncbi:TonB-dependent receptor [Halocola ammonii]